MIHFIYHFIVSIIKVKEILNCSLLALVSFRLRSLGRRVQEKRPMPWVETYFDPTIVHNLGLHSSNRMPHDMFADCDLSPPCPAHSFVVFPLLLGEPTQQDVAREDSVAK